MKIVCEACSAKYSISDDKVRGKVFKIRCKKCSHIIVVKGNDAAAGTPAVSAEMPMASSDAVSAVPSWYIVVDGEQVGPLSEADIGARLARGEVTGETFAWKEGLADWMKLSAIPELASLGAGAPGADTADGGPFSPAPTTVYPPGMAEGMFASSEATTTNGASAPLAASEPAAPQVQAQPDDLFGAPTSMSAAPAELFSAPAAAAPAPAARARAATPSPAAFGGAAGGFGGAAASARSASPDPGFGGYGGGHAAGTNGSAAASPRVEGFTGQRSENSVLFSLSNLEALAAPGPAPAAAPARSPGSGASSTNTEGSGLIDIRAMAATVLGNSSGPGGLGAPGGGLPLGGSSSAPLTGDLPSFGAGSFSPVAPVLLPIAPQSSGPPKWVWAVLAVGGAAVVLLAVVAFSMLGKSEAPPVAAPAPVAAPVAPVAAAPAAPTPAPPAAAAPVAAAPAAPEEPLPPRETAGAAPKAESKADKGRGSSSAKAGKKGTSGKVASGEAEPAPAPAPVAAAPAPEPKKASSGDKLDDLLSSALGGSSKKAAAPKVEEEVKKPAAAPAAAAGPLTKEDIVKGMMGVQGKVHDCYTQFKVPGTAMVNVTVGKSGKVDAASVSGKFAGTPTGTCVESAVKSAKFPPNAGMNFPYPIPLR